MKSKYAGKCSKCERTWNVDEDIFISKSSDGQSWIKCPDKECFESQGGKVDSGKKQFQSAKFPIGDAPKVMDMAFVLLEQFEKKQNRPEDTLSLEDRAKFICSVFGSLSGGFKPQ